MIEGLSVLQWPAPIMVRCQEVKRHHIPLCQNDEISGFTKDSKHFELERLELFCIRKIRTVL